MASSLHRRSASKESNVVGNRQRKLMELSKNVFKSNSVQPLNGRDPKSLLHQGQHQHLPSRKITDYPVSYANIPTKRLLSSMQDEIILRHEGELLGDTVMSKSFYGRAKASGTERPRQLSPLDRSKLKNSPVKANHNLVASSFSGPNSNLVGTQEGNYYSTMPTAGGKKGPNDGSDITYKNLFDFRKERNLASRQAARGQISNDNSFINEFEEMEPKNDLQAVSPIKREDIEDMMFKEIFVDPREKRLNQIKLQELKARKEEETAKIARAKLNRNHSEPHFETADVYEEEHSLLGLHAADGGSAGVGGGDIPTVKGMKKSSTQKSLHDGTKKKQKKSLKKTNFFDQQIQVQPPDSLNFSVAAPLTPGGGWAPSIPAALVTLQNTSLKDMTMRAKAGVQAGDIQKEAHMAFCLGVLNEEKRHYKDSIKFYKRFFFCARLLDDPVGAALALNRLGVVYYNYGKLQKSLQFHAKHREFSDKENVFAALYNLGITHRKLANYAEAADYLSQGLEWVSQRQDTESECLIVGQLGLTFFQEKKYDQAMSHFMGCLEIAQRLGNTRLQLDSLLYLSKIANKQGDGNTTHGYLQQAYNASKNIGEAEIAQKCHCNMGIALGNVEFAKYKQQFTRIDFSDNEDEEEDQKSGS